MGPVRLAVAPERSNVRIARLVAGSACRTAGLTASLIDDIRLAVGEACSRAVALHQSHDLSDSVTVEIEVEERVVSVSVCDHAPVERVVEGDEAGDLGIGPGEDASPSSLDEAISLPDVMTIVDGLADELEVRPREAGPGIIMVMRWHIDSNPTRD